MNFYLDTEFVECEKQRRFLGFNIGAPVPTIDVISLALVREDGESLYLLNRDCELDYAWANDFVREKVLGAIYCELVPGIKRDYLPFNLDTLRGLFHEHGVRRREMASYIVSFVFPFCYQEQLRALPAESWPAHLNPVFYGYYADYDWVLFCQLFGRMNDLPQGFPKYCRDLKQLRDELGLPAPLVPPDPANEHHAEADAHWNRELHAALLAFAPAPISNPQTV